MNFTPRELKLLAALEPKLQYEARGINRSNCRVDAEDALQAGRLAVLETLPRLCQDQPEEVQLAYLLKTALWRMKDLAYDATGIHCPCSQRAERNAARKALATGFDIDLETRNRLGGLLFLTQSIDDSERPELGTSIVDELESDLLVKMLLDKMSDEDASAFSLVFLCDYSYQEAAEMLGMTNATLRSRLRAAKRVLNEELVVA